jgi:threonine aldolase
MKYFKSDNTAAVAPQIMSALSEANAGFAPAYGDDDCTRRLQQTFSELFERDVVVFPVATGTAANTLALATLVPPWGAIVTHAESHIVRDECGAPEFMTHGARLMLSEEPAAKLTAEGLTKVLDSLPLSVHTVQPRALSVTQATELGTVYERGELEQLTSVAHARGLRVHMDGARFANAVAHLGCRPADITWRAGVDALSFGATKNGAMAAEAVVFFDRELVGDFEFRRKRAAHLFSKMRFLSAQLLAYVQDDLWLRLAGHANSLAARIGKAAGSRLLHPVQSNEIFMKLGDAAIRQLREADFAFYDWGVLHSGEARFVVSWHQPESDVDALCQALQQLPTENH